MAPLSHQRREEEKKKSGGGLPDVVAVEDKMECDTCLKQKKHETARVFCIQCNVKLCAKHREVRNYFFLSP